MKKIIRFILNFNSIALMMGLIIMAAFLLSVETNAQVRRGHVTRRGAVRSERVHENYARVVVGHGNYFYRGGRFYRRNAGVYRIIAAPIGARIRVLPLGYVRLRAGLFDYYYCNGIYYSYLPDQRVYVVVQKPANVNNPADLKQDQVKLYDGSILNGVFQSATDSTVTLIIGDEDRVINISDIVSINFAQTISSDSTEQK